LTQGDVRFEPDHALKSGERGMDDIQAITAQAKNHFSKGGWLVFEHGYDQKELSRACLLAAGFKKIEQKNDLSGQPRMSAGH
jgi:release factor glutamine methyltransferase